MGIKHKISGRLGQCQKSCRRFIKNISSAPGDETNGLLTAKIVVAVVVGIIFFQMVVPDAYDRYAAQSMVVAGLMMIAYGLFGPWDL